ncbi:MAG: hypothetical protein AAB495_04535 [Patescibacteria group bacterium]
MSGEIKKFFIDESSELHGKGGSKDVWVHKNRPDMVVKEKKGFFTKTDGPEAVLRHHVTNIIHLVTDGGVPRSRFSFSKEDLQGVEKVDLGAEGDLIRNFNKDYATRPVPDKDVAEEKISTDPRIVALRTKLREIRTPFFDDQPKNLGVGEDGRAVYVDAVVIGKRGLKSFIEAVVPEIEKMTDEAKKEKALRYLERVKKILEKYPDRR